MAADLHAPLKNAYQVRNIIADHDASPHSQRRGAEISIGSGQTADNYPMRTPHWAIPSCARTLIAGLLCAMGTTQQAMAQSTSRPTSAGRVVKAFDFEERDTNPLPIPFGWIRAQEDPAVPRVRPGFPIWNHSELDYHSPAYAGIGSVRLPTNGGSTSLMLRHGELSVFPHADYLVSVRIRTEGLDHARARVVATLLDQFGEPIESSRVESRLVRTDGDWDQVAIEVEGLEPGAAFMQLELQLLQPEQQPNADPLAFQVWAQDYTGAAWFDNLIVAQLPRLEISTGHAGNIVSSLDAPDLNVLVRDLTGEDIYARLRVYDVHDRLIDDQVVSSDSRRVQRQCTPNLPGFGWYRALLEVQVEGRLVGVRALDFIWAPPEKHQPVTSIFGIETSMTDPKLLAAAPMLVEGAGVSRATLRVWDKTTRLEDLQDSSPLFAQIDTLLARGDSLRFELSRLPQPLATTLAVDPQLVLTAFSDPNGEWGHWGSTMLDRYGQRVRTWTFGDRPSEEPTSKLRTQLNDARVSLEGFVPGPIASIPWPIDRPIPANLSQPGMLLQIEDNLAVAPEAIGPLVEQWDALRSVSSGTDAPAPRLGFTLAPIDHPADRTSAQTWTALGAIARKAISFWWAAHRSNALPSDFSLDLRDAWWVSPGKRGQVMPAPELIVWRTLSNHLGGRDAVETLDLIPGVKMLVLSDRKLDAEDELSQSDLPGGGLVLWLDRPSIDPVILSLPLSLHPVRQYDVLGNQTIIEPIPMGNIGVPTHSIEITRSPIIVEGVDGNLVRFLSNLQMTPDRLESSSGAHRHTVLVENPWPIPIAGRIFIVEPGGYTGKPEDIDRSWEIVPRMLPFNLAPGEQRELPVELAYSLGEIAGEKELVFDVEIEADREYPTMRVQRSVTLGLSSVDMTLSARRNEAGITVITADVVNTDATEQNFEIIAVAPGEPRIRRSINALQPGQHTQRQFAFSSPVPGDEIIVVLLPRDTSTRLNKSVTVP
jgi:hypothetical protein